MAFQAEISTEENDRIEAEESGEIISGAIAGDSVDSGISLFLWTITRIAMVLSWMEMQRPCMIFWCRIMWWITASIWTVLIFFFEFPDTITFEAVVEDGSFQRKGESYVQATNDVKTAIQAASDAFFPMIIHRHSGSGAATMDTGSAVFGMDPLLPDTGEPLRISPLNRQTGKSVRMPILEWGIL